MFIPKTCLKINHFLDFISPLQTSNHLTSAGYNRRDNHKLIEIRENRSLKKTIKTLKLLYVNLGLAS